MFYRLDTLPNQTEAAHALQQAQHAAWDRLYEAYDAADPSLPRAQRYATPAVLAARQEYEATVTALTQLFGENAPCHQVDEDMWSFFSDVYKDEVGCRPGEGWTRPQVKAWLDQRVAADSEPVAQAA